MARTFVKAYEYNDPELIEKIGHLLGSDEWYREHSQHIWRKKGKTFYLLCDEEGVLISVVSLYKNLLGDAYTVPALRHRGHLEELPKEIVRPGMKFGTANPYVVRIANKFGFKYASKRGKYEYFEN